MRLVSDLAGVLMLLLVAVAAGGCSGGTRGSDDDGANVMRHSKLLKMTDGRGYTLATVVDAKDSTAVVARYVLVDRDAELPDSLPQGTLLRTPLDKVALFSTVFAGVLDELGRIDAVRGVVDASYFSHPAIKKGLAEGSVADLGEASGPSIERIVALQPQAIILSIYDGMDVKGVDRAGVPVIQMADNLESTPLGRAEWIRFVGALTGRRTQADSIFNEVEKRYTQLAATASSYKNKPKVLVENMYQGVWYVPGGKSYQARMLSDAGAAYPWADDPQSGSISLSFEQVLARAGDADFWLLKLYGTQLDRETLEGMDSRYVHFKAVDNGGVYYSDTSVSPLFEEFPFHPERLLSDYIAIFHPESKLKPRYFEPMR